MNEGTLIRNNVKAVQTRLNGTPETAIEWQDIARRLRAAADAARQIAKLAQQMNNGLPWRHL